MYNRIEICGGIASGKSTLAKIFEDKGYSVAYERFEDNPFLKDFYVNESMDTTLETELSFVMLHSFLIKKFQGLSPLVCDYSLIQDKAYGLNNLSDDNLKIFNQVYNHFINSIMMPKAIVFLECDIDCLLERIKTRGIEDEQLINSDYLNNTVNFLKSELKNYSNVLIIPSDKYDFLVRDREYVFEIINAFLAKCHYV